MSRVFNFSPGPALLPDEVMVQVQEELRDWHQTGMSVMELPHRGQHFKTVAAEAEQDLRDLLSIPDHYHVLFLTGGARSQFAMVPMNLLGNNQQVAYVKTGVWSKIAAIEAQRYTKVQLVTDNEAQQCLTIADESTWQVPEQAAYAMLVDNETVNGLEFAHLPKAIQHLPVVSDMSSNLLSRPINIDDYGLIFASAQKNIGPAGLTIVIVRDDLLKREPLALTPSMWRYQLHADNQSMQNTPPTFPWYVSGLVFKWIKRHGGLSAMAEQSRRKSEKLYAFIDDSDFYINKIDPRYRSRMNIIFELTDSELNSKFLTASAEAGLMNLKGHRFVGGMRASIYNAMPEQGVDALIDFMKDFSKYYG